MEQKRLCRSMEDKAICGVCSGFAKYFDIDPIIIRLAVVLLALTGTIGVWFYIVAAIVMPKDTEIYVHTAQASPAETQSAQSGAQDFQPGATYTQNGNQFAYRYDPETGRPLYSDGTNVYENYAGTRNTAGAEPAQGQGFGAEPAEGTPVQDVEFTAEPFGEPETPNPGDTSGEYQQPGQSGQPGATEQPGTQNPYQNFQAYNGAAQGPQTNKNFQAYQTGGSQPERKSNRGSRNTGILLIIIGAVILAKIILPRINLWIPVAIASIFFGIFLLCRKN